MSSVPWLVWRGGMDLACLRCGAEMQMPEGIRLNDLVAYLDALVEVHRHCRERPSADANRTPGRGYGDIEGERE